MHSLRVWAAQMPRDGEFDVSFYFVDPAMARRIRIASAFTLTIFYGGKADTLEIERDLMKAGWNYLGRYKFAEGEEAAVELSDRAEGRGGSLCRCRAMGVFFDPENPDAYEDEMPTFTGRGRGGPGGGPGGARRGW